MLFLPWAVSSASGSGFFAIPWGALALDEDRKCFILDVDKQRLQNAPGFDKDNWPDMADPSWGGGVSSYWRATGAASAISGAGSHGDDAGINAGLRYNRDSASFSDREVDEKAREAREAIDSLKEKVCVKPRRSANRAAKHIRQDKSARGAVSYTEAPAAPLNTIVNPP